MGACTSPVKDHFVLRGEICGVPDSSLVILFVNDAKCVKVLHSSFKEVYVKDGKFEIQRQLDKPTHCTLRISEPYEKYPRRDWSCEFFMENGELTFRVPCVDSLPLAFKKYDSRKEKNYTLQGSNAQDLYVRYQRQTADLRHEITQLEEKSELSQEVGAYKLLFEKKNEWTRLIREFIQNQNNWDVNLLLAKYLPKAPFTYDREYVKDIERLFESCRDTATSFQVFLQAMKEDMEFAKGKKLEDATMQTQAGKQVQLRACLNGNGYTLIDFWASWCSSCRAGFPALKELYGRYGEKIKFMSVAISDKKGNWKQAMKEENMPWEQFLGGKNLAMELKDYYRIASIPKFLLIDREGRVVYCGSRCGDLESQLELIFNK